MKYQDGAANHMTRDTDAVVRVARRLHGEGLACWQIARALSTGQRRIGRKTVRNWVTFANRVTA